MTITLAMPMRGPVDTTADKIVTLLTGPACKYSAAQVAELARWLVQRTGECGIRTSLIAGQIAQETGRLGFGGQVQPYQFNFAGLGATNGGAAGASFNSIDDGVMAVLEHHCAYIGIPIPAGWPKLDWRFDLVASGPHAGKVQTIGDYTNGRWAYTPSVPVGSLDNGYARAIVAWANQISTGGGAVADKEYPDKSDLGFDVRIEPTDFDNGERPLSDIKWFIVHDTEGHYEGDIATLTHGSRSGSIHAIIGRDEGQFCVSVPIRRSAFACGNDQVGDQAIQVELSKHPPSGEVGYTDWQYRALAAFFRWCETQGAAVPRQYFWPHPPDGDGGPEPDEPGYIGHYGVPSPDGNGVWGGKFGHTDPGNDFDWERLMREMNHASVPPPGVPAPPADGPLLRDTKDYITGDRCGFNGAFKRLVTSTPFALQIFGEPLANEHHYRIFDPRTGATVRADVVGQECERAFLEYNGDPRMAGTWDATVLPRTLAYQFIKL